MKSVYVFLLWSIGLAALYVLLTSANQNNAAAATLIGTGSNRLRDTIRVLQGR